MKSVLTSALSLGLACSLVGCSTEATYREFYGEDTPGILYTPKYDYYTRADNYPANTGGWYYSYGGRYEGGGYGYDDPFNH